MARIRTVKPELWLSAQVMNLSHGARLLFIGLITQGDDDGRGSSDPRKLKAAIFGGDDVSIAQVSDWLTEIVSQRLAVIYEADGYGALYWLPSWREHQVINKSTPSRYPPPVDNLLPERYRNTPVTLPGDRKDRKEGKEGSEGATGARRAPRALAPGAPRESEPEVLTDAQRAARAAAAADNLRQLRRAGVEPGPVKAVQ